MTQVILAARNDRPLTGGLTVEENVSDSGAGSVQAPSSIVPATPAPLQRQQMAQPSPVLNTPELFRTSGMLLPGLFGLVCSV